MFKTKLLACGLAALCLVGCGGGSGLVGQQQPRVRLFNGADGQASIFANYRDVNLANLGNSPNATFGSSTTDTIEKNSTITATLQSSSAVLVTTPPALLRNNSFYTTFAYGQASQGYHGVILEDSQAVASGTNIGVRAIELGSTNTPVDVFVLPSLTTVSSTNQLFTSLAFGTVTTSNNTLQAVDANGYILDPVTNTLFTVTVTAHGSTTPLATTTFTAVQGSYYTIVVFDSPSGSTTQTSVAVLTDKR